LKHQGLYKNEKEEQNQANHKFIDIPVQFASDLLIEQTNEKLGTIIHKLTGWNAIKAHGAKQR
jgi:hypothetical protein